VDPQLHELLWRAITHQGVFLRFASECHDHYKKGKAFNEADLITVELRGTHDWNRAVRESF